jgi:hypothetical protein
MNDIQMDAYDYARMCMKKYGTKTIENRAIPDYRDGMLPVQRRLLYGAFQLGNNKGKSARLIGETLGRYYPHGDMAANPEATEEEFGKCRNQSGQICTKNGKTSPFFATIF